ncbi:multidrug and toxin extrusion protein 1 [Phyllopteryx taeniolatus]|uniref:multidrug and toxin extrusion protein 1 n=1 Tax=Phyllopteryx taeniolatus TaxID=161469 RepID=UPI002AD52280|nr:multidrug and toxin extrusion protein 1 [Phyllopteryx taeniolatus]XP_061606781.1 multidrug and toxin extrusion protein 1 [Phyllopteryx taeniolatus]
MEKPAPEPQVGGPPVGPQTPTAGDVPQVGMVAKLLGCRWLPPVYREELYEVLKLMGPLLLFHILNFLQPLVISIFCGHIGTAELAGYALASAIINVSTTVIVQGLTMACDTLISQTYGSKNLERVGVILQRSSLILLLFCLPCWAVLINAHHLLLLMHQDHHVARIAQLYMMAFLPAVPSTFLHQLQVAYLQNQGIILPQMYTAALANLFNLGANYVLIVSLKMGVVGSAVANSLAQVAICLLLYAYIRWKKLHRHTWGGWSTECLQDWGSFMRLAVPSIFMVCFEWWIWEIGGFLAGVLGEADLAAQHVMVEISAITYMFPLGIQTAACVRVGNALGAGDTARAILSCKVALVLSGLLAVPQGIVIVSTKSVLGYVFTSDENIAAMVSENLTIYTFLQFFDSILCVCSGILVGCGMQKIAAASNLVSYYCIGLPIGVALMFAARLRIFGLWLGLLTCVCLEASFFLILIFKLNWKKVTKEAEERAGKKVLVPNEVTLCDCSVDGQEASKSQDREAKDKAGKWLSATQLVLRRGFALLAAVITLAVGVAVHLAFPVPEISMSNSVNFTKIWTNVSTDTPSTWMEPTPMDLSIRRVF